MVRLVSGTTRVSTITTPATEISLDPYMDWIDSERIVINVASLYREYGMKEQPTVLDLWADMSRFHKAGLCNCGRMHTGFKAN